jgi:hypothetical protein
MARIFVRITTSIVGSTFLQTMVGFIPSASLNGRIRSFANSFAERVEGEDYKAGTGMYGFAAPFTKATPVEAM